MSAAALPMYDWPEVRAATDTFWHGLRDNLRRRGLDAPDRLDRGRAADAVWHDPDLLIAQTCGLPYVSRLRGVARLVATPVYDTDGCRGSDYCSIVVVRGDDPAGDLAATRGRRVAFNGAGSQSGYSALRAVVAPLARNGRFFADTVESGTHLASMRSVAEGLADLAAIDSVCWGLARRYLPDLAGQLRELCRTPLTPGLPLITAAGRGDAEVASLRAALDETMADPAIAEAGEALLLSGFETRGDGDYDAIAEMAHGAERLGYPALA